jgi:hypothetical protein
MATYGKRQKRQTTHVPGARVILAARMDPALRAKANEVAAALDVSVSYLVALLISAIEVDGAGRPLGIRWDAPPVRNERLNEGLPGLELSA